MDQIYGKARAKINLCLNVVSKRDDGYHNIQSIFQKINLYDELWIRKVEGTGIKILTNWSEIKEEDNILYKAYHKLREEFTLPAVEVTLKKKTPMQTGMGGGSADCATFLLKMNQLCELKLTKEQLVQIGKSLGADVPSCLYEGATKVEGIGEKVTKIETQFKYYLVILKPKGISFDTKSMYQKIDAKGEICQTYPMEKIIEAIQRQEIDKLSQNLYNVFEETVKEEKEIWNMKRVLIQKGAVGSLMTGSGSCVYGIFENKEIAKKAYRDIKEIYEAFLCTPYNRKR